MDFAANWVCGTARIIHRGAALWFTMKYSSALERASAQKIRSPFLLGVQCKWIINIFNAAACARDQRKERRAPRRALPSSRDQSKGTRPIFTFVPAKFSRPRLLFQHSDDSFNKKPRIPSLQARRTFANGADWEWVSCECGSERGNRCTRHTKAPFSFGRINFQFGIISSENGGRVCWFRRTAPDASRCDRLNISGEI